MSEDFLARLEAGLEEARRMTPEERFERMVRTGLINRRGELTKGHGGDADPEPEAGSIVVRTGAGEFIAPSIEAKPKRVR